MVPYERGSQRTNSPFIWKPIDEPELLGEKGHNDGKYAIHLEKGESFAAACSALAQIGVLRCSIEVYEMQVTGRETSKGKLIAEDGGTTGLGGDREYEITPGLVMYVASKDEWVQLETSYPTKIAFSFAPRKKE